MSFTIFLHSNVKNLLEDDKKYCHRNRKRQLIHSEIITILVYCYFGLFANFKHYYKILLFYYALHYSLFYVSLYFVGYFSNAISCDRFVDSCRLFFYMISF